MFYKLALNTTCVIFVNFNSNKKDLWILQILNLVRHISNGRDRMVGRFTTICAIEWS
jgi:hypothetical protein